MKGGKAMKKSVIICLAVVTAVVFGFGNAFANPEYVCPEGKLIGHLKIIGVTNDKNVNMEGKGSGNVIFVDLGEDGDAAETQIFLIQGEDYAVVDKNGTDGDAAFMLPKPDLDPYIIDPKYKNNPDTLSDYSVYIRALGTPGGKATMYTCGDILDAFGTWINKKTTKVLSNPEVEDTVCSLEKVTNDILVRTSTKPKFINVTAELLTIVFQVTVDQGEATEETFYVRVPIFSGLLENEYWQYNNEGLKNLDVRFYDCSTDVSTGDSPYTP